MSTAELSASLLGEQAVVYLSTVNPDALLLEPREWYDPCITGVASYHEDDWWAEQRDEDALPVFVYDYDLLVKAFMAHAEPEGSCSMDEAQEFVDFNMAGAWVGVGTPIIVTSFSDDEDEYDLDAPTEEAP
jgi:hypothetical protein